MAVLLSEVLLENERVKNETSMATLIMEGQSFYLNEVRSRVHARIFFSFATTFANLIFLVPISLNLGHLSKVTLNM